MHTSTLLTSSDFQYWHIDDQGHRTQVEFATFCPQYHALDRIGVVVPRLDLGVYHTGYALLALTTVFYDVLRQSGTAFFDYPHHFAFLSPDPSDTTSASQQVQLDLETLGGPWSALDVWPESNWIVASETVGGMLHNIFNWQINRLFWPQTFMPDPGEVRFPEHVWKILANRLKTVYYYHTTSPTIDIRVTQTVEDLMQRSLSRIPDMPHPLASTAPGTTCLPDTAYPYERGYQQIQVDDFLAAMQS